MRIKSAVLSISLLLIMSGAAISPALGSISETFSQTDPLLIQMVLTLSSMLIIPASIISGQLVTKIKKRKLLITGLCVYIIGGIGGAFARDIYTLLVMRGILGIGVGLILPLSTGLIVDFYDNGERQKMMGYSTAINNLGAVGAIILSGLLASINWRFAFAVYGVGILTLLLVIFLLPEPEISEKQKESTIKINGAVVKLMVFIAVVNIVFYTVPTNIALIIKTQQLGSTSISGFVIATLNLTSFIAGMNFGKIYKRLQGYTAVFALIAMALGFFLLTTTATLLWMIVSLFFIGLGLGIILPYIFVSASTAIPGGNSTFTMALVNSSMYLGQFLSPLLVKWTSNWWQIENLKYPFQFSMILMLLAITITVIGHKKEKNTELSEDLV